MLADGDGRVPGADFERFAAQHLPVLLRTATALCGDPRQAEDLTQDVLLKVFQHWERVRRAEHPDAYVRRMLVNKFLSWRRARVVLILTGRAARDGAVPDPAENQADRDEVAGLLRALPRKQRAVLALRYYVGSSDAEIAATLGCSPLAVRSRAARAMATLRAVLALPSASTEGKGSR